MGKRAFTRISNNRNKKKKRRPKVFEVVTSILKPSRLNKNASTVDRFFNFLGSYQWDDYEEIIKILLKEETIKSSLNQYCDEHSAFSKASYPTIHYDRLLSFYKLMLINDSELIEIFDALRIEIEGYILSGEYDKAKISLEIMREKCGFSIWYVSTYFNVLALNNNYEEINDKYNYWKSVNKEALFDLILSNLYRKVKGADVITVVEDSTVRMNEEMVSGGAPAFASLFTLLFLPYPIYGNFETPRALFYLQLFPLVDVYYLLLELTGHVATNKDNTVRQVTSLNNALNELAINIDSHQLRLTKKVFSSRKENNKFTNNFDYSNDKVLAYYNEGDYLSVINYLEKKTEYSNEDIVRVNIYAKSHIFLNKTPSAKLPPFFKSILEYLISIYLMENSEKSINEVYAIAMKHHNFTYSRYLIHSLTLASPYFLDNEQRKKLLNTLVGGTTPMGESTGATAIYAGKSNERNSKLLEVKVMLNMELCKGEEKDPGTIFRLLAEFEELALIRKDFIEIKVEAFRQMRNYSELVGFAAAELLENASSIISFPVEEIASYIDENCFYSEDAVIFAHFYSKLKDRNIDRLLNEVFEEYIFENKIKKPSLYLSSIESISRKEAFIFGDVATPSLITYLAIFKSSKELSSERLQILEELKRLKAISDSAYTSEYVLILEDFIIDVGVSQVSRSKINIDKSQFMTSNFSIVQSYLDRLNLDESTIELDKLFSDENLETKTLYAKGTLNELAISLYEELARNFLTNENYGLDKNLSSEIRHSFFSNQITSTLRSNSLNAELNIEGRYETDSHWTKHYSFVNSNIMKNVEQVIAKFVKHVDVLIAEAETWMKVCHGHSATEGVFRISRLELEDFKKFKEVMQNSSNPNDTLEFAYQNLTEQLSDKLSLMQKKLHEEFLNEMDKLFGRLLAELQNVRKGTQLAELFNAVNSAQEGIKDDIKIVCEWFSLKSKKIDTPFLITNVVDIAERCFKDCFNSENRIVKKINSVTLIDGSLISNLVFTLISCFHNVAKYGVINCKITVDFQSSNDGFVLKVSNPITKARARLLEKGVLRTLQNKIQKMESTELLFEEGNTGLYKCADKLKACSKTCTLVPKLENQTFTVEVRYYE
ncbi:hypothetical protein [Alteromonas macleodii]|uniref:hypothetical protein n=1 Tax=Alteromonas macleodii TaxID=28108 RepID=UPI003BF7FCD9